jgi:heme exporter protein C
LGGSRSTIFWGSELVTRSPVDRALLALLLVGGSILVWLALVDAPAPIGRAGFTAPEAWRLFFFHVPVAFTSFLAFGLALYHSLFYLLRPHPARDAAAHAAVEGGLVFSALTLGSGMAWGQAEWGTPWRWSDAKLVLVLLMFLIYLAYLLLRREISDPERRARVGAVYAVAAFATIPLAWFAQRIWLSYHPTVFGGDQPEAGVVTPGILPVFLLGLAVFAGTFLFLHRWRREIFALADRIDELETAEVVET